MKCAYCHPKASSAWQKEMNKDGPMYMAEHLQSLDGEKIYAEDDNPYVDAMSNGLVHAVKRFRDTRIAAHVTLSKGERSELAELATNLL